MSKIKIQKVSNQTQQSIPVKEAFTIFDQNSQTFKKLWIGSAQEYTALTEVDDSTIYLIQQDTV